MAQCPYCHKTLRSIRGVTQHINQSPACLVKQQREISRRAALDSQDDDIPIESRRRSRRIQLLEEEEPNRQLVAPPRDQQLVTDQEAMDDIPLPDADDPSDNEAERPAPRKQRVASDESSGSEIDDGSQAEEAERPPPNTQILEEFRSYCAQHSNQFIGLTKQQKSCIKLMDVLRRKAPLSAYAEVMEWHLKETGVLREHESLGDAEMYQHRKTLMKSLQARYNLTAMMPKQKKVRLPSSKAVVTIPYRDAADCIVSLLTDPRFKDEDYLFFNDDPLAPPPEEVTYLADLNTGDAYLKSYEHMITKDNQVLLPVPLYIDGANTGQFTDLPVTALKMSLGIHKREARDCDYAWRELGFVPVVRKDPARGKKMFQDTGHLEADDIIVLEGEGDVSAGNESESEDEDGEPVVKAQDFHTMLKVILESFVELQRTGFKWDLVYKGKVYRNVEFVIFVPFVKCDTEEADLLCGKYTVRTSNVKHVCRYCHCPTSKADDPRAKFAPKTQAYIQNLVNQGNLQRLQAISQQNIKNAWYDVTFHRANAYGIHGACPSEKLHAIQLGIFKYIREIFFLDMGKDSQLAVDVNGLATMYGKLLSRQSERDLPNTNFAKGIQKGKLMARDFRGVLLIMAAVLRSTKGRDLLFRRRRFGQATGLRDWTLLVELMLEWEAYLCEKRMNKVHVKRLAKKHRFIMYIMRCVARRSAGMGLKVMKFHAIIHLIQDMLLYGVPTEFDTGSNESHHKQSKHAARLTQRKESTFNFQTATRLTEFLCIDLGMEEVANDRGVWEYFDGALELEDVVVEDEDQSALDDDSGDLVADGEEKNADGEGDELKIVTGGTHIRIFEDEDGEPSFRMLSRSQKMRRTIWMNEVIVFLNDLQNLVIQYIDEPYLPVMTQQKRGDHVFYGHPNYRSSGPWKDWVIIDWGQHGRLPCHIWCFVRLSNMPMGANRLEYGGIVLGNGIYAVVEVAEYDEDADEATQSDLFAPLLLEVQGLDADGRVTGRKFYLADTDSFAAPCCVVPNIGGPRNAYFQVKPRRDWTREFIHWLEAPHADDVMEFSDEEKEEAEAEDME